MHHHEGTVTHERRTRERGASAVEYALLLALIAGIVFSAVSFFGENTRGGFGRSADCISVAYEGGDPAC
ncbi:MAG TPA: hypothetical protein VHK88_02960 [Aquihabitans sp.]|nr:hypothetical protein [Aquihabitans sp.]